MFKILSTYICLKKYIKCNIWRVAVRPPYIQDGRFLKVKKQIFVLYMRSCGTVESSVVRKSSVVRTTARVFLLMSGATNVESTKLTRGHKRSTRQHHPSLRSSQFIDLVKKIPGLLRNWQRTTHFIHYAPRAIGVGLFQSTAYTPLLQIF